jgi:predicted transposase/invertase (TIGR01784 family)
LREIEALEEGIKMAETVVKGFTKEQLEYIHETYRILQEMDWNEELHEAKQKGIALGNEKGKAEVARALKALGAPVDKIAAATGLTPDEISKL